MSRWLLITLGIIALPFVVAVSVAIGYYGSPDTSFDWALASVFGTALGTTLLALATGGLALLARSEMSATQDLARATREQYAASERPIVLQVNAAFSQTAEGGLLVVYLRNVGLGPALRIHVSATYDGHADWQPTIAQQTVPVVMSADGAELQFPVRFPDEPHSDPQAVRGDRFHVVGKYLDRSQSLDREYDIITSWPEDDGGEATPATPPPSGRVVFGPPSLLPLPPSAYD